MKIAASLAAATPSPARVPFLMDSMNWCLRAIMSSLSTSAGVSGAFRFIFLNLDCMYLSKQRNLDFCNFSWPYGGRVRFLRVNFSRFSPVSRHFSLSPVSRDFLFSPVSRHFSFSPFSRDFLFSPVYRDFLFSPVSRHFSFSPVSRDIFSCF